jgi:hypothetical protein
MKFTLLFLFQLLSALSSCHGKATSLKNHYVLLNELETKGDTVKELGSNIMVIYQDTKNTYWFGS